jgi:outer membrane murein-binding lipoprotein Lpp
MLGLILSPLGRWLAAAAVAAILIAGAYVKGRMDQSRLDDRAGLLSTIESLQRDIAATKAVSEAAAAREQDAARAASDLQQKVDDYARVLAAKPDPVCALDDVDLRVLERLRNAAPAKPADAPGGPLDLRRSGSGSKAR